MKVLHLFDAYLNSTMNWAHNFMQALPEIEHLVSAPIRFDNAYTEGVTLLESPMQKLLPEPKDEWSVPKYYRAIDKFFPGWYNNWIQNIAAQERPDIIHAHFGGVGVRHMRWIEKLEIPFVTSFYGFDMEKLPSKKPEYSEFYRELAGIASSVLVLGQSSKNTLKSRYGFDEEQVFVQPLGIDVGNIPFHKKTKPTQRLRLLQLATITPKKGQLDAVKALHKAKMKGKDVHLTLSGERWDKAYSQAIESYISKHHLEKHIRIIPFTPHDKIFELMKEYDAFIHPSQYTSDRDSEGGATFAILEAMAAGLPVISTNHRMIPKRVKDGQMGFITPEKDIDALARSIVKMYEMGGMEYEKMSLACRQQIEKNFDSFQLAKNMYAFYEKLSNNSQ